VILMRPAAEGVQFEDFAGEILVQASPAAHAGLRVGADRAGVVEIDQHRRMGFHGEQHVVEAAEHVRPDGLALVDNHGVVIEFLSYEGVFAATNGPATGLTSTDIGVRELGNEPAGMSLARSGSDTWSGPAANSFGACNDDGGQAPPQVVTSVTVSPTTANVVQNSTQSFLGSAFDASNQPIAGIVFTWTSSVPSIATISANGIATGIAPGDTTITATAPNGVFGSSALHVTAPSTGGLPDIRFTELHYDNAGTDVNEAIEIEGPAGADLTGYTVVLYDGNGGSPYGTTQTLSGPIPATCNSRGVIVSNYPANGIQNGSPDGLALVDAGGHVVEFLSYEGAFVANGGPASGLLSFDIGAAENSSPVGQSLQRDSTNQWHLATSTFGACNTDGGSSGGGNHITFSGRSLSDPALPVGFQAQLFATLRDAGNAAVTTTFTWSSETPAIASIDQNGVMTAIAEGSATFRATATDGTTATDTLPTIVAVAGTTAIYTGNTEFGEPQDADPSDDFIVRYPQYTASYNVNRGTPNWVSYVLDPTDYGTEDRCNCFTPDPALPASFPRLSTNDYTGAGAIAGYGIDRGHMTPNADRDNQNRIPINQETYLMSNMIPQAPDNNQGPWANLEGDLRTLADFLTDFL